MFKDDFKDLESNKSFEGENLTGKTFDDERANTPVKVLTAKSIIGDKVENRHGEKLGDIKDIMLNVHTGCSEYVVLEYGGFLGMGEKLFAIPFKALVLDADKKVFILDREKEYIKKSPGFDRDHWPETNSRHLDDVNSYWDNYPGPNNPGVPFL
jgi:sporulation protein YlmC with PRC-barrel domain